MIGRGSRPRGVSSSSMFGVPTPYRLNAPRTRSRPHPPRARTPLRPCDSSVALEGLLPRHLAVHQVVVAIDAGLAGGFLPVDGRRVRPLALDGVQLMAALAGGGVPVLEPLACGEGCLRQVQGIDHRVVVVGSKQGALDLLSRSLPPTAWSQVAMKSPSETWQSPQEARTPEALL